VRGQAASSHVMSARPRRWRRKEGHQPVSACSGELAVQRDAPARVSTSRGLLLSASSRYPKVACHVRRRQRRGGCALCSRRGAPQAQRDVLSYARAVHNIKQRGEATLSRREMLLAKRDKLNFGARASSRLHQRYFLSGAALCRLGPSKLKHLFACAFESFAKR
jgi:hypothetical protein